MLSRQILHIFNIVFGEAVPPRTCIAFGTRVYVIICTWLSTLPDLLELSSNCAVCAHDLSTGIVTILRKMYVKLAFPGKQILAHEHVQVLRVGVSA